MVRGEGATQGGAPARRLALGLRGLGSLRERKVRGLFGVARGRGAVPLPCFSLSQITPVGAPPLSQGAGDSVGDVSRRGGVARWGGWG